MEYDNSLNSFCLEDIIEIMYQKVIEKSLHDTRPIDSLKNGMLRWSMIIVSYDIF